MFRVKKCGICGGEVKEITIKYLERHPQELGPVIFEDVPAQQCAKCGERFYPSEVALTMDSVIQKKIKAKKTITLPLYPISEYLSARC